MEKNLSLVKGKTVIFADIGPLMERTISGGKNYGSMNDGRSLAKLLGLMILEKCENAEFFLFKDANPTF